MDRISNNFMSSLRSDKTPVKSSQKSKANTPSPYPYKSPLMHSSNNTKRKTLSQIGTQSQKVEKVGNKANRNSIGNPYFNKSVSPQPTQSHSYIQDKNNNQWRSNNNNNQNGIGNDYKKIFNMENIINATQQNNINKNNQNDNKKMEIFASEPYSNNSVEQQQNQYFSSINSNNGRVDQSKGIISGFQSNIRPNADTQNNLFSSNRNNYENNLFFRKDNNNPSQNNSGSSIDLHRNTSQQQQQQNQQEVPSFFRTNYQQEKLFQGAQKNIQSFSNNTMEDENQAPKGVIKEFFSSNGQQSNNEQSKNQYSLFNDKNEGSQSKNVQNNIFAIKPPQNNIILNQNTGIVLQERNQNPSVKNENSNSSMSQIYQKDPQSSQSLMGGPSNLKDLRQRHKQLKSESGEKSFSLQNTILDKIKDINEKMKFYAKKTTDQGENSNEIYKLEVKNNSFMKNEDVESSINAPTINDQNKTLEDSLIQKLRLVVNQEEEFDQSSLNENQNNQSGNTCQQENQNLFKEQRNKFIATKLDMIQESNASKNSFVSGNFYQSGEGSRNKENQLAFADEIQLGKKKEQGSSNMNIFSSQISDIYATRKNLFGKYTYKEEEEDSSDKENKGDILKNDYESHLFESSDESVSEKKIIKKGSSAQAFKKNSQDGSCSQIQTGVDMSIEGRQNMTNSLLDKAFIGDITGIYSADRNNFDTSLRTQDIIRCETTIASQNHKQNHSDIFTNNQDSIGFNQDAQSIKRLDQLGCSDISPIQSQVQVKSSNSGSKKDNNLLIDELNHIPQNTPSIGNELEISQIQIFDSQSLELGKNSTIPLKKPEIISSQNDNQMVPLSQSMSYKPENSGLSNENLFKDEIQTPLIQHKLKKFLEDVGYYNNDQRKEQINDIMSKITLGLVIDKARVGSDLENKTIIEEGVNLNFNHRVSIGQCSDYQSCKSRFSITPINDMTIVNQLQENNNQQCSDKNADLSKLNQNQSISSSRLIVNDQNNLQIEIQQNDQESIENKHFEALKQEVEFLYQLCKGEDQAEKEISQKIVSDVLCPKFGQKTLSEAFKLAVKKGRQIRDSLQNKKKRQSQNDNMSSSNEVIVEKEEEESDNKSNEAAPIISNQQEEQVKVETAKQTQRGIKRKNPTRGNQRKKGQSKTSESSLVSSDDMSESEGESNTSYSATIGGISNQEKSKTNKQNKNKKLKK